MQGEWPCPYIMKTYRGRDLIPNGVVIEKGHPTQSVPPFQNSNTLLTHVGVGHE